MFGIQAQCFGSHKTDKIKISRPVLSHPGFASVLTLDPKDHLDKNHPIT